MLTEFESRLADVLGSRIPAPFGGRVVRRGDPAPVGSGPVVRLGVDAIEHLEPDIGSVRPESVPGAGDPRRVLRLRVGIGVDVESEAPNDLNQELLGADAITYQFDDPGMRSAEFLIAPGDQGFVVDSLRFIAARMRPQEAQSMLTVEAEGWFWPVGIPGQSGREIAAALVREFRLPVSLQVAEPLVAGGDPVALELRFGQSGTMRIEANGVSASPFGGIALRLIDAGGAPGAGALDGGTAGPDGQRLVALAAGVATVDYLPPDAPATDTLIALAHTRDDDGEDRIGIELARFDLVTSP